MQTGRHDDNVDNDNVIYDIEHHDDHLVVHDKHKQYLYDPIHHFLIERPADDKQRPGDVLHDEQLHKLIDDVVDHGPGEHDYDSA
jgi:hypothetical protein